VRTHPESGRKALFVNRLFTTMLEGRDGEKIGEPESEAVLRFLLDHLETPELACRFRRTKGSIAFWDNRATLHRPVNDHGACHRLMERITIEGDVPQ
jgi:taurine dioxygenase